MIYTFAVPLRDAVCSLRVHDTIYGGVSSLKSYAFIRSVQQIDAIQVSVYIETRSVRRAAGPSEAANVALGVHQCT